MTNEQKNQVAAMNASGMSVDEITIDTGLDKQTVADFVAERNAKKKGRGHPISEQTKQAIIEWYQSGHPVSQTAKKFGVDPKTVKNALGLLPKEKEPTAAATATDPENKNIDEISINKNTTENTDYQALRGVEVIGLMQTMLIGIEENFGDNVEVMSLKADSDTASIMFRYGGTAYSVQFGLAF